MLGVRARLFRLGGNRGWQWIPAGWSGAAPTGRQFAQARATPWWTKVNVVRCRPNGPTARPEERLARWAVGPVVPAGHPFNQGVALAWDNHRTFGPLNYSSSVVRPVATSNSQIAGTSMAATVNP